MKKVPVRYLLVLVIFLIAMVVNLDRSNVGIAGSISPPISISALFSWAGASPPS
ncbi:MAG: hypothetical protein U1E93_11235 [Alphaproteobacteria bacterium]